MRGRDVVAAITQGRAHAVTAFADGCIRKTHGVEMIFVGLDTRDVHFNFNDVCINPVHRGAESLVEHDRSARASD